MFGALARRKIAPGNTTGHTLFVYGTLLPGELNHDLIQHLRHIRHAALLSDDSLVTCAGIVDIGGLPALYMLSPGLHPGDKSIVTKGVLYRVTHQGLGILDQFEGHPTFYKRTAVHAQYTKGGDIEQCMAHAYYGGRPGIDYANGDKAIGELMYSPDPEARNIWVSDYRLRASADTVRVPVVHDRTFIHAQADWRPDRIRPWDIEGAFAQQAVEENEIEWEDEEEEEEQQQDE